MYVKVNAGKSGISYIEYKKNEEICMVRLGKKLLDLMGEVGEGMKNSYWSRRK